MLNLPTSRPGAPTTLRSGSRWLRWVAREQARPRWSVPARLGIFGLAACLYFFELSRNGYGDYFYAATVKTGSQHLKSAFFGSLDPTNFITVDKPPLFLWVQELFAKLFGFGSWALLVPEALMGLGSVMILYHLVRKWVGEPAAVLASMAFALTPVAVLMFRINTPDGPMTFLLLCSMWALWSALETAKTSRIELAGALLGAAFLTKMLEAWIVAPVFALVYLVAGSPSLRRRVYQVAVGGVAMLIAGGWWIATVALWPAAARPYISGTSDNSILSLVFGYNGFNRIGPDHAGSSISISTIYRMFSEPYSGQIAWILPMALAGLAVGLWATRSGGRCDITRAGYLLWGGWLLAYVGVLSGVQGLIHPYYTVVLAPPAAALAGAGVVAMWLQRRQTHWWSLSLPAAVVVSALWAIELLSAPPNYHSPLLSAVCVTGVLGGVGLYLSGRSALPATWRQGLAATLAVVAIGLGMAGFDATTIRTPYHLDGLALRQTMDTTPQAGPSLAVPVPAYRGPGARTHGPGATPRHLIAFLNAHQGHARFAAAVRTSRVAASYMLWGSRPLLAIGGWGTTTNTPTLANFRHLVAQGQVHYTIVSGPLSSCSTTAVRDIPCVAPKILRWVEHHGRQITPKRYGGPLPTVTLWRLYQ